jgi:nickel-dependent lactate racemase
MHDGMDVGLAFGRGTLAVRFPADAEVTVIRKAPRAKLARDAIARALAAPIGAPPFEELVRGRTSACILVCDITRPVPNALFLRPMIEAMLAARIPRERITILIATGLHRPNTDDELVEVIGDPWVLERIRVANHFARNDADHVDLGVTATRGTPIKIDRRFMEADLRIATGLVEPHFMAGYSGGRKVIAPGVAHADTIRTFHSARFMEDPHATSCVLHGNPLHEEQLLIVRRIGESYALNTVIDEQRDLVYASFGETIASHLAAVQFAEDWTAVPVARRFKTVVTSAAGFPLDKTYYQTVKGMVTPLDILEPGGTLIVASECAEGIGSAEFRASQARLVELGPDAFLQSILGKRFADVDEWQSEMQLKPMRVADVQLYAPALRGPDWYLTGVAPIDSVDDAVRASVARHGDGAVAVIPEGPYVIPQMRSAPGAG